MTMASCLQLQEVVGKWCNRCFGSTVFKSLKERSSRSLEEAIELGQAAGVEAEYIHKLVDYVYARPKGEVEQELAGLGVTLLAFAEAAGLDLEQLVRREISRILHKHPDHFRERHQAKADIGISLGIDPKEFDAEEETSKEESS
jgi:NTP pyrophosphatase (non-canonical NTP hydrolase)